MMASPAADAAATRPARTVFFGSGPFAVPMLDALLRVPEVLVVAVVSVPDRPAGRGRLLTASPVAAFAATRNVPVLQPPSLRDGDAREALASLRPDLGVLADYGRLVPTVILDLPPRGFLNVHPSKLPRHRGAAPIPATILGGDADAGVTIIRMDAGIDTGPIVAADTWPLRGIETARELEERAGQAGAALLARTVPAWLAGDVSAVPQSETGASRTQPLHREDGRLDGSEPALLAERRVRAFDPWPGTFLEAADVDGGSERAAILRAAASPPAPGDHAGLLVADGAGIALSTIDGRLRLLDVRPASGRSMTGEAWLRGRPGLVGLRVVARGARPAR